LHILEKMLEAIEKPREILSPDCPAALSFPQSIPELIGTVDRPRWAARFKGITERTNTKIDIEDWRPSSRSPAHDGAAARKAQRIIEGLTRRSSEGEQFSGTSPAVIPIGPFGEILPRQGRLTTSPSFSEARREGGRLIRWAIAVTCGCARSTNRGRINLHPARCCPRNPWAVLRRSGPAES